MLLVIQISLDIRICKKVRAETQRTQRDRSAGRVSNEQTCGGGTSPRLRKLEQPKKMRFAPLTNILIKDETRARNATQLCDPTTPAMRNAPNQRTLHLKTVRQSISTFGEYICKSLEAIVTYSIRIIFAAVVIIIGATDAMAIEEATYNVLTRDNKFEIRDYSPHILAETVVEGEFKKVGNQAFRRLFRYISGENRSRAKMAMTAPVSQEPIGEKIKMTAPVGQQRVQESWAVSFMIPASYTLETLPEPEDPKVTLRQVPARRIAAVRYSGFWNKKAYLRHKLELESWIHERGLTIVGDPVWARYNPPFTLWFLRRNEILIPVEAGVSNVSDTVKLGIS